MFLRIALFTVFTLFLFLGQIDAQEPYYKGKTIRADK
jgi:hypothetical protein